MSIHKHNSWGRTRSPKNIAGPHGTEIVALVNTTPLKGITGSTEGYSTENQRYLHVLIEESTLPAVHVPAARAYRVYEIHGIDRVAFVGTSDSAVEVNIFAACSTF